MKVVHNKAFEQFRKLETGKVTLRICEIMKWHQTGLTVSLTSVTPKAMMVISQTTENKQYTLQKHEEHCNCKIVCLCCQLCAHTITIVTVWMFYYIQQFASIFTWHMITTGNKQITTDTVELQTLQ